MLDAHRGPRRPPALEQQIDERAVAAVGRHAPGRGMRLVDVAELLELGEHVPDGRRRHPETALLREHLRRHGLARIDVVAYEGHE
ncbi:hypothetical protein D3C83_50630 [compost metagenome]